MNDSTSRRSSPLWRWGGAVLLPLALICLFELLHSRQELLSAWVFGVMAPLEQQLGRLTALVPFSVGEVLLLLFLVFCLIWLVRAVVLLVRGQGVLSFLRRLCALGAVFLWIWAGVCWLWNAAYYIPSFSHIPGVIFCRPVSKGCPVSWSLAYLKNQPPLSEFPLLKEQIRSQIESILESNGP